MTDFLLKIATLIFGGFLERRRREKILSEQFETLKRQIIYETLMNNFTVHLANLRDFFLKHNLVKKPKFNGFFDKWLTNPLLSERIPMLGMFTNEQITQMKAELSSLQM